MRHTPILLFMSSLFISVSSLAFDPKLSCINPKFQFQVWEDTPFTRVSPLKRAPASGYSEDAEDIRNELEKNGANCTLTTFAPERGFRCKIEIQNYSQPIDLFIPAEFQKNENFSLAYHFHGFTTSPAFNPFSDQNGDFGKYLTASGKNAILVVPESTGADQTYKNELDTIARVNALFAQVNLALTQAGVSANGKMVDAISGHSGASVQLDRMAAWANLHSIPALNRIRAIALFDSAYEYPNNLLIFAENLEKSGSHFTFFGAYNPADGDKDKLKDNETLESALGGNRQTSEVWIHFIQNPQASHMTFMSLYMTEFFEESLP